MLMCEKNGKFRNEITIKDNLVDYYLNKTIKNVTESLEVIDIRKALNEIIQFTSELTKYKVERVNEKIFTTCKKNLVQLLHPFIPHVTEEIWQILGNNDFLSLTQWPSYKEEVLTLENEYKWKLLDNTINSINQILQIVKKRDIKSLIIIIAAEWKYRFVSDLLDLIENLEDPKIIIKELLKNEKYKEHTKVIPQIVGKILKKRGKFVKSPLSFNEEYQFFINLKQILEKKYSCTIKITSELKSLEQKATQALPGRPAIILK